MHCLLDSLVERWKAIMLRISWFIDRVISSNPWVALVMGCYLLP
jgi:hypothetical protein